MRTGPTDWFRLGHVEAVRAALGATGVAPPPVEPGPLAERLARVAEVATAAGGTCLVRDGELHLVDDDDFTLGALAQRVLSALWAEDLAGTLARGRGTVVVRVPSPR